MQLINYLLVAILATAEISIQGIEGGKTISMHADDRVAILDKVIESGKSGNVETDRDMHVKWDEFRQLKNETDSQFDALICTDPEKLRQNQAEMDRLSREVELGWTLKQEQLKELVDVLHHENYTSTGLSNGNDSVEDLCQGLQDYIDKANQTAWENEKPELDQHLQEVDDLEDRIDSHPCPCVWGEWGEWSVCSTTCEAGSTERHRVIEKEAINNGTECEGDAAENDVCNEDVCCPVNCEWGIWTDWPDCPSGQNQTKIRTREKIAAECQGLDCQGEDYERIPCSREIELFEEVEALDQEVATCDQNLEQALSQKQELEVALETCQGEVKEDVNKKNFLVTLREIIAPLIVNKKE